MSATRSASSPSAGTPSGHSTAGGPSTVAGAGAGTGTAAVASVATFVMLVVFTVPLTTLTDTAAALSAGPGAQAWILSAMPVGAAAGLLAAGALGDGRGRRRVFVSGAVLMAAAAGAAALAPTAVVLIAARVLEGLGGAALLACGLGLLAHAVADDGARARATAVWGAALGAGVAAGPVLAAGLLTLGGWRWVHGATAIAAAAVAVAGLVVLNESRAARPRPVDAAGTLTLGVGVAAMLGGLIEARSGWARPTTFALLIAGIALVAVFVVIEHRSTHPMLELGLFGHGEFVGATVGAFGSGAGILALSNLVPTMVERGLGASGVLAAVVLLAWSATSAVTALAARWLPARFTARAQLVVGLVVVGAGVVLLLGVTPADSPARLLPGLFVAGAANGLLNAALGRQAIASVPAEHAAMGSGANNTARYLGSAIGIAAASVLLTGAGTDAGAVTAGWNAAVVLAAAITLTCALAVAVTGRIGRDTPTPTGPTTG